MTTDEIMNKAAHYLEQAADRADKATTEQWVDDKLLALARNFAQIGGALTGLASVRQQRDQLALSRASIDNQAAMVRATGLATKDVDAVAELLTEIANTDVTTVPLTRMAEWITKAKELNS